MAYQDLPWQRGSSHSFDKLLALNLPPLKGRTLLDVGCNTGYFCGFAAFQQAVKVQGIDINPIFIEQAKTWFPECSFTCMSWDNLNDRAYDIVLCISALHYAKDQEKLIEQLMQRVTPTGMLVLEVGIAAGDADEFIPVARNITQTVSCTKLFPTFKKVETMLARYSYKYMGPSVAQAGDPTPRHIFHVHHKLPYAALLLDKHYAGKSSVAKALFKPELKRVLGEGIYHDIADGKVEASSALKSHIRYVEGTKHMQPMQITADICAAGLTCELAAIFCKLAAGNDFVLETYIPQQYRLEFCKAVQNSGFFVVDIALLNAYNDNWAIKRVPFTGYEAYLKYLDKMSQIDEDAYLAANPDVAKAIENGEVHSARAHYWHHGRRDKRPLRP